MTCKTRTFNTFVRIFFAASALVIGLTTVYADVPYLINYRGFIADKPGTQNFQIAFKIYDQASGGNLLWSETQPVDLFDGNFSVLLGSVTPFTANVFADDTRFIAVQIAGENELTPRQQLASVPFAFNADLFDGYDITQVVRPNTSAWLKSLGVSQTVLTENLTNLVDIRVHNTDSNGSGLTIQGTPSSGDMGIHLSNYNTGGKSWMVDSTDDSSSHFGGGKLVFFHLEKFSITPRATTQQEENQPSALGPIYGPAPIVVPDPIFTVWSWVDVMTLNGTNNRVGILTDKPNYTLDVRGTIGNNSTQYHSDVRWKKNVESLDRSLDKVLNLRGVHYDWKSEDFPNMEFPEGKQVGLIAQEVEQVAPEVVATGDDGYKSVDYARLVPLLIESIKEQQKQIQQLQSEVENLKKTQ